MLLTYYKCFGVTTMLRFDIPPVHANVIRWEAFLVFCLCLLALFVHPLFMIILPVQGFIKGFFGHHKCPSHNLWKAIFTKQGWAGKKENVGAKMFAAKLLFLASTISLILYFSGIDLWKVPCTILVIFSFLEWAFSFCVACSAYNAWYKFFPPKNL